MSGANGRVRIQAGTLGNWHVLNGAEPPEAQEGWAKIFYWKETMKISREDVLKAAVLANLDLRTCQLSSILLELNPHCLARLKTLGLLLAHIKAAAVVVLRDGESGRVISFQ